jgi:hypothetical protein
MPPRKALSYVAYEMPATCPWHDAHRSFNSCPIDPSHDKSGGRVGVGVAAGRRGAVEHATNSRLPNPIKPPQHHSPNFRRIIVLAHAE